MYLSLSLPLYLSSSLSFCWSGHVFSSLWSNVSKVKSLKDCFSKVFSKCNCLCLCICLCHCLFVGQVMFLHDPPQFCKILVWSGRLWIPNNEWVCIKMTRVGLELLARADKNGHCQLICAYCTLQELWNRRSLLVWVRLVRIFGALGSANPG